MRIVACLVCSLAIGCGGSGANGGGGGAGGGGGGGSGGTQQSLWKAGAAGCWKGDCVLEQISAGGAQFASGEAKPTTVTAADGVTGDSPSLQVMTQADGSPSYCVGELLLGATNPVDLSIFANGTLQFDIALAPGVQLLANSLGAYVCVGDQAYSTGGFPTCRSGSVGLAPSSLSTTFTHVSIPMSHYNILGSTAVLLSIGVYIAGTTCGAAFLINDVQFSQP